MATGQLIGEAADRWDKDLDARQLLDHAPAGPLPPLQEDQEIGHLLPVRPLVELPDDVGADLARGGQDPKEIPPRRWSERVSEASRILPKHRGASVSAARRRRTSCSTASRSSRRVGLYHSVVHEVLSPEVLRLPPDPNG
jgi:hypothetical protein